VTDVYAQVADRFTSRFLRSYTRSKLRHDPVYRAVLERLRGSSAPLFDIGCGIGLLEFFLRESGFANPIIGIDHDPRKVTEANRISASYRDLEFRTGDARDPIPAGNNVALLDVLHYFSFEDQARILNNAAVAAAGGGVVIIRDAIRDGTLRYRMTVLQERFSRAIRWLRAERLNFPTDSQIRKPFEGFVEEVVPMWGGTPFNNYLFVFRRSADGMTKR
jgi:SAM-dependent methyltransferase